MFAWAGQSENIFVHLMPYPATACCNEPLAPALHPVGMQLLILILIYI
ncbi:MAG: hypothetical protein RIS47_1699 [Bacteroidota bacterium]|jgi:hypothetical protein